MVIKKKSETNGAGLTIVYDENNVGHEIAIADYPLDSVIVEKNGEWYFDAENSPFTEEAKLRILNSEQFYYMTKDFLPYAAYAKAYALHSANCLQYFKRNPYFLLDIEEIEELVRFSTLDKAVVLSTFEHRMHEMRFAIREVLKRNESSGHTWMPYSLFKNELISLLKSTGHPIPAKHISAYVNYYSDMFYRDNGIIAFQSTLKKETYIYEKIQRLMSKESYSAYLHNYTDELSEEQNDAVKQSIRGADISIITGGPGTGKTTTLRKLVSAFKENYPDKNVMLLAPTGKASRRIKEVFQDLDITIATVHYFIGFGHSRTKQDLMRIKAADFIIIDEGSMIGVDLFYGLLSSLDVDKTKILITGDVDQLPSVEPGNILSDMINMGVQTVYLNQNFRSADLIHKNAAKINSGDPFLEEGANFTFVEASETFLDEAICNLTGDIILTPYRKETSVAGKDLHGSSGTINKLKHKILFPGIKGYAVGEPIIMTRTDYKAGYMNGETGTVASVLTDGVSVAFDGKVRTIHNVEDMAMAHAVTIHKSQGSEYDNIIICVPKESTKFFTKQMLYTAITRAKKSVTLVGCKDAIFSIVANNAKINKRTFLSMLSQQKKSA